MLQDAAKPPLQDFEATERFIQVHDMEFGSIDQIVGETIPALRKVQAAGKARSPRLAGRDPLLAQGHVPLFGQHPAAPQAWGDAVVFAL